MSRFISYKLCTFLMLLALLIAGDGYLYAQQQSSKDTILSYAMIYNGDTIEAKTLADIPFYARYNVAQMNNRAKWTRLRNAVYVTFPYAKRASIVINDINTRLVTIDKEEDRKIYIKSREKELRNEFTSPLTNLSIYQGKVLMKLINRETGNNCYQIIKEYKGGFNARVYQTVAFFFTTSLKQPYDKNGEDTEIEKIVQEVERMYGIRG
jgi:Domain of unknown function (DUF4294)